MSATLEQVEQQALALSAEERARLADKLWESLADRHGFGVVMTPALERLLDEGMENLDQAQTTDKLRSRK